MGNKLTQIEINKIIENHKHWLNEDVDDWESMRANFSNKDLSDADLSDADLSDADFCGADLSGADLSDADLSDADLLGAKNMMYIPMACPEEGSFIGFKKAVYANKDYIVKLEISVDARRSSATSRKCRCDKAKVLEIQNLDGSKANIDVVYSAYDPSFQYKTGQIVEEPKYDDNRFNICSKGIHFFINRQEAVDF